MGDLRHIDVAFNMLNHSPAIGGLGALAVKTVTISQPHALLATHSGHVGFPGLS